ncbi:MBL fold metallo-hydrolase [Enterovirga aerilata]|uniref:MBL fold metallo-hydrolase n=1 Tax=Enterovirga aerilata TaxID=2730920 RepID=A0A849I5X4_9HYPH|nr:MBL fold metallo-hydrolase [Enterovirga sp. DB1703]NNM74872.1 MBL fold metallo-hydrolase [Enterovirga sp. DB1703]
MADELSFDLDFAPEPERAVEVSPLLRRIVAANPGPFTFKGTCTYLVGRGEVAVVDPGPADERHVGRIIESLSGERVSAIAVTHTHRDHSPGARMLQEATGAPILGCGPHRRSRELAAGETDSMEGAGDLAYRPDREMREGDIVQGEGWTLEAIETPGHTANHLVFRLAEEEALLSGDHVMGWSTTIVAPPDGSMSDFMASLEKLRTRPETTYWPGHGGPVRDPQRFVRALIHHRRQREASILNRILAGDRNTAEIVRAIYQGLNPALFGAARLSVFAHLEDLVGQGKVRTEGPPQLDGEFRPA